MSAVAAKVDAAIRMQNVSEVMTRCLPQMHNAIKQMDSVGVF